MLKALEMVQAEHFCKRRSTAGLARFEPHPVAVLLVTGLRRSTGISEGWQDTRYKALFTLGFTNNKH